MTQLASTKTKKLVASASAPDFLTRRQGPSSIYTQSKQATIHWSSVPSVTYLWSVKILRSTNVANATLWLKADYSYELCRKKNRKKLNKLQN